MPKTVVAVIIYNRFHNLEKWVNCWKHSDTTGAELRIVHNYASEEDRKLYQSFCESNGIVYIPRKNIGLDIGALQDISRRRLPGFDYDYENLIWITDDTIPMRKDWVGQFLSLLKHTEKIGAVCYEISNEVTRHIRTTGVCMKKEVVERLQYPSDPITTLQQCYFFEHRGGPNTLLNQIIKMGFDAVQLAPLKNSPLWDMDKRAYLRRDAEHYLVFPGRQPKVLFICPAYNNPFPEIVSSLICQTHQNWELHLIHDGPCDKNYRKIIDAIGDKRIVYKETGKHIGNYGHPYRAEYLERIAKGEFPDIDFVVITNADNYHTPVYTEYMLKPFANPRIVATYCSDMVHSYIAWKHQPCRIARGHIDCAGVMVRARVAAEIGWRDTKNHSSDWTYFSDIARVHGEGAWEKVFGTLLVHN